jgi:hypothetical protein
LLRSAARPRAGPVPFPHSKSPIRTQCLFTVLLRDNASDDSWRFLYRKAKLFMYCDDSLVYRIIPQLLPLSRYGQELSACSVGWWLMAGAGLF